MKVYVINVPTDTERLEGFRQVYPEGLPEPIVYPAKTGKQVEVPDWWHGTANSWALLQNVKDIIGMEHSEPFMICEDDCAFAYNFEEALDDVMEHVPADWDIIYPGGRHEDLKSAAPIKVNDYILKCRYTAGTFCLIINPDSAQKILSLLSLERWPCHHTYDDFLAWCEWAGQIKAYAPLRFIAGQRGGVPSTLQKWTFQKTVFFNEFRYYDLEHQVFLPSGTLYEEEEDEE